jgi:glycerophosphoryl diester phosphodiesterase
MEGWIALRRRWIVAGVVLVGCGGLYAANASWLAPAPAGVPGILAHRGVHQTFSREGLTKDSCTARRIDPPTNPFLENTIPSMQASFAAGATAIEVDVHPTTDGEFAVFHDWTLECRTNGHGVTREHAMTYLKTLDAGFGYTADGGRTYPFRGKGVGLIPTLHEVLMAFPGKTILINIKSRDPTESERLVAYLKAHGHPTDRRLWVYAVGAAHDRLRDLAPDARVDSNERIKTCAARYLAFGWSGHVPDACKGASVAVPINLRWAYWGWPNRFLARMKAAGVQVLLVGPYGQGEPGISQVEQLEAVPAGFDGMVLTDAIERIGPAMRKR